MAIGSFWGEIWVASEKRRRSIGNHPSSGHVARLSSSRQSARRACSRRYTSRVRRFVQPSLRSLSLFVVSRLPARHGSRRHRWLEPRLGAGNTLSTCEKRRAHRRPNRRFSFHCILHSRMTLPCASSTLTATCSRPILSIGQNIQKARRALSKNSSKSILHEKRVRESRDSWTSIASRPSHRGKSAWEGPVSSALYILITPLHLDRRSDLQTRHSAMLQPGME